MSTAEQVAAVPKPRRRRSAGRCDEATGKDVAPASEGKETAAAAAASSLSARRSAPRPKPRRPLSAYNLFFKQERSKIPDGEGPSSGPRSGAGRSDTANVLLDKIIANKGRLLPTPSGGGGDGRDGPRREAGGDGGDASAAPPGDGRPGPRVGAAHGGAAGFADLARTISRKWKALDESSRSVFEALSLLERKRYERELDIWNKERAVEAERTEREALLIIKKDAGGEGGGAAAAPRAAGASPASKPAGGPRRGGPRPARPKRDGKRRGRSEQQQLQQQQAGPSSDDDDDKCRDDGPAAAAAAPPASPAPSRAGETRTMLPHMLRYGIPSGVFAGASPPAEAAAAPPPRHRQAGAGAAAGFVPPSMAAAFRAAGRGALRPGPAKRGSLRGDGAAGSLAPSAEDGLGEQHAPPKARYGIPPEAPSKASELHRKAAKPWSDGADLPVPPAMAAALGIASRGGSRAKAKGGAAAADGAKRRRKPAWDGPDPPVVDPARSDPSRAPPSPAGGRDGARGVGAAPSEIARDASASASAGEIRPAGSDVPRDAQFQRGPFIPPSMAAALKAASRGRRGSKPSSTPAVKTSFLDPFAEKDAEASLGKRDSSRSHGNLICRDKFSVPPPPGSKQQAQESSQGVMGNAVAATSEDAPHSSGRRSISDMIASALSVAGRGAKHRRGRGVKHSREDDDSEMRDKKKPRLVQGLEALKSSEDFSALSWSDASNAKNVSPLEEKEVEEVASHGLFKLAVVKPKDPPLSTALKKLLEVSSEGCRLTNASNSDDDAQDVQSQPQDISNMLTTQNSKCQKLTPSSGFVSDELDRKEDCIALDTDLEHEDQLISLAMASAMKAARNRSHQITPTPPRRSSLTEADSVAGAPCESDQFAATRIDGSDGAVDWDENFSHSSLFGSDDVDQQPTCCYVPLPLLSYNRAGRTGIEAKSDVSSGHSSLHSFESAFEPNRLPELEFASHSTIAASQDACQSRSEPYSAGGVDNTFNSPTAFNCSPKVATSEEPPQMSSNNEGLVTHGVLPNMLEGSSVSVSDGIRLSSDKWIHKQMIHSDELTPISSDGEQTESNPDSTLDSDSINFLISVFR